MVSGEILINRINSILEELDLTVYAFSKKAGIDPGNMNKMLSGSQNITENTLRKICQAFNINYDWMYNGEGVKYLNAKEQNIGEYETVLVPMSAFAGGVDGFYQEGVTRNECMKIISPVRGVDMAIQISGDSMEPKFFDGSYVYIKRINERLFIPWGTSMVIDTVNGAFIKDVYEYDEYNIEVRSINPKYPPFKIPKEAIIGMYRILGSTKFYQTV